MLGLSARSACSEHLGHYRHVIRQDPVAAGAAEADQALQYHREPEPAGPDRALKQRALAALRIGVGRRAELVLQPAASISATIGA